MNAMGEGGLNSCKEYKPEYKILTVRPVIQKTDVKNKFVRIENFKCFSREFPNFFTQTSGHLRNNLDFMVSINRHYKSVIKYFKYSIFHKFAFIKLCIMGL